ncbi:ArsC/Spx/MgsR family protein [Helicobacter sp.]|uniref:arsenate reductase family protein n=1 Tax=Helicobacter sp. TaxID=218 RepID=UPI0025C0F11B|nr:ArsC/Spx/MgsR family protein [Helicobacter sp.]MBR2494287.1 arsenate reductase family protein [Helicobacter sp.]
MEAITIYGIKTCGSVQKARKYLESKNLSYEFVDWKTAPLDSRFLEWLVGEIGVEVLLNTKGATYKKLGLKERTLNPEQKQQLMLGYPLLIKRPVITYKPSSTSTLRVIVGFDESCLAEVFG